MELTSIGLGVLLTYWNKNFMNSFQNFDQSAFRRSLLHFTFIAIPIIILSVYKDYLMQVFQLRWRRWLTNDFLNEYLTKHAYYHMSLLKDDDETTNDGKDNPDQRISVDIDLYIEAIYALAMGLLNSFVSLVSYIAVLWSLSGVIKIGIAGKFSLEIKGSMVWSALIYAGLGTFITHVIGRSLFHLKYQQEQCEANFRYGLVRLRDHTESIAFYQGELNEKTSLESLFDKIISNFHQLIRRLFILNWFTWFYKILTIVFPFLIAAPRYFSREITLGDLIQIALVFKNVYESLSFIPRSYQMIVRWRSATKRLIEFQYVLQKLHMAKQKSEIQILYLPNERSLRIQELIVRLPQKIGEDQGRLLINSVNLVLEPYQVILITGKRNGCNLLKFHS
ncbi:unnamed protein product [Rotaria sp. Silwood2]|nr:unnamed protein product [Rotaria sp. Silwood2]CAF2821869.1 unnamed protein product [Rotaria sp. Silwood2]CAF3246464.1 unnamed protein product [Rotaria sp. Silwood2]CAF4166585.1 unnamed protein product [Rotaria sp. Silwood2]CAF4260488.1 unnamed protein product [Rotaria sp. Silwood2]